MSAWLFVLGAAIAGLAAGGFAAFQSHTYFRGCPGKIPLRRDLEAVRIFGLWGVAVYLLETLIGAPVQLKLGSTPTWLAYAIAAPVIAQAGRLELVAPAKVVGLPHIPGDRESYYARWFRTYLADAYRDLVMTCGEDERGVDFLRSGLVATYSERDTLERFSAWMKGRADKDDLKKLRDGISRPTSKASAGDKTRHGILWRTMALRSPEKAREYAAARAEAIVRLRAFADD